MPKRVLEPASVHVAVDGHVNVDAPITVNVTVAPPSRPVETVRERRADCAYVAIRSANKHWGLGV